METRLATKIDASVLALMHAESFGDARWSRAQIAGSLALETTLARVVVEQGTANGFIICQLTGGEAEILTVCVSPIKRQRKLGTLLLNEAMKDAKAKGSRVMFLEVAADNVAALALYAKAGFREKGRRPVYYKRENGSVDALRMEREL